MTLEIKNVHKVFNTSGGQVSALHDVNLIIPDNKVIGLVGESGSGKSTLGKLISGLENKSQGEIFWNGELMPQHFKQKSFLRYCNDIQMIFQDPYSALNPRMTVGDIIEEPLRLSRQKELRQLNKKERSKKVDDWLEKVGMSPLVKSRYPHEFSGGQRQRVGIARALITEPKLLICDEPISALDVSIQAQVINLLKDLQQDLGMSLLFIAHDLAMVNYVSDEIVVMYLGKVMEHGSAHDIFSDAKHPYTKLLMDSNLSLEINDERESEQSDALLLESEIPSPLNLPKGCRFESRCPERSQRCAEEAPELRAFASEQRKIACFNC